MSNIMPTDTPSTVSLFEMFNIERYTPLAAVFINMPPVGGGPIEATERVPLVWTPVFEGDDSVGVHNCRG
jgi:hypothetical protein